MTKKNFNATKAVQSMPHNSVTAVARQVHSAGRTNTAAKHIAQPTQTFSNRVSDLDGFGTLGFDRNFQFNETETQRAAFPADCVDSPMMTGKIPKQSPKHTSVFGCVADHSVQKQTVAERGNFSPFVAPKVNSGVFTSGGSAVNQTSNGRSTGFPSKDMNAAKSDWVDSSLIPDWAEIGHNYCSIPPALDKWPHQNEIVSAGTSGPKKRARAGRTTHASQSGTDQRSRWVSPQRVSGVQNVRDYFDFANRPKGSKPLACSPVKEATSMHEFGRTEGQHRPGGILSADVSHGAAFAVPRVFSQHQTNGTKRVGGKQGSQGQLNNVPRVFQKAREMIAEEETQKSHAAHRNVIGQIQQMADSDRKWSRIGNVTYGFENGASKFSVDLPKHQKTNVTNTSTTRQSVTPQTSGKAVGSRQVSSGAMHWPPLRPFTAYEQMITGAWLFDINEAPPAVQDILRESEQKYSGFSKGSSQRPTHGRNVVATQGITSGFKGQSFSTSKVGTGLKRMPIRELTDVEKLESGAWLFDIEEAPAALRAALLESEQKCQKNSSNRQKYVKAQAKQANVDHDRCYMVAGQEHTVSMTSAGAKRMQIRDLTPQEKFESGSWLWDINEAPASLRTALLDSERKHEKKASGSTGFQMVQSRIPVTVRDMSYGASSQKHHVQRVGGCSHRVPIRELTQNEKFESGAWLFDINEAPTALKLALHQSEPKHQRAQQSTAGAFETMQSSHFIKKNYSTGTNAYASSIAPNVGAIGTGYHGFSMLSQLGKHGSTFGHRATSAGGAGYSNNGHGQKNEFSTGSNSGVLYRQQATGTVSAFNTPKTSHQMMPNQISGNVFSKPTGGQQNSITTYVMPQYQIASVQKVHDDTCQPRDRDSAVSSHRRQEKSGSRSRSSSTGRSHRHQRSPQRN